MSKIIPFNNNNEEETCACPTCDLILEFISYVKETKTVDELFDVLSDLVNEAKVLGIKEHLVTEIDSKIQILDHLDGFCECSDDECDC